jgi:hypothetical protein
MLINQRAWHFCWQRMCQFAWAPQLAYPACRLPKKINNPFANLIASTFQLDATGFLFFFALPSD